jgi:ankyrin repeat/BTB/POZ domain-containing protein 1
MLFAAKHLEFHHLYSLLLEQKSTNDALRSHSKQEITLLRHDFEKLYIDMITVAMRAEPQQERTWIMIEPWTAESLECSPKSIFADIAIKLHNNIIFPCHKAYLCRVEFFNTMLSGPFGEQDAKLVTLVYPGQANLVLPLIELHDVDADIFGYYVLQFIYTDKCNIPAEDAYDVLLVADMLLIDRLKAMAAIVITNQKEPIIDIYELIQTAIELQVERVEQYCIKYFARHLDDFIHQPQFLDLIKQSAASIKRREETGKDDVNK